MKYKGESFSLKDLHGIMESVQCCICEKKINFQCDSGTVYGCANPEDPEPYDPEYFCKGCARKEYKKMMEKLDALRSTGILKTYSSFWQHPEWYSKAVKDAMWKFDNHDIVCEFVEVITIYG